MAEYGKESPSYNPMNIGCSGSRLTTRHRSAGYPSNRDNMLFMIEDFECRGVTRKHLESEGEQQESLGLYCNLVVSKAYTEHRMACVCTHFYEVYFAISSIPTTNCEIQSCTLELAILLVEAPEGLSKNRLEPKQD